MALKFAYWIWHGIHRYNSSFQLSLCDIEFFSVASLADPAAPAPKPPPTPASSGGASAAPAASGKPEYPKDLGNGVEKINREDCPGGYCETFLIRPPPPGMGYPMPMGMGGMGMPMGGMGMGMGMPAGGSNPCCPQLPPSPCGGMQQPPCQLGPPPQGCNSPCPPPPMVGR